MEYITEIAYTVNDKNWTDNLKSIISSTTYQLPAWLELYKKPFNSIPIFITVKNTNSEIVGQLACIIHEEYNWRNTNPISKFIGMKLKLNSILSWSYGPIIHDQKNQETIIHAILKRIEEIVNEHNITMVRGFSIPNDKLRIEIFEKFGYSLQKWSTYFLDLKIKSETLLSNLNKKIRYDIKQAEKRGLVFEIIKTRSTFNEFVNFAVNTKIQQGETRNPNKYFRDNLWEIAYKKGFYKAFLAKKNNEILGAIDLLLFNENAVQVGVTNSPKREYCAGPFLTWNTIKWAIDENLKTFDFGGANPTPKTEKERQIDFYKSKWNNEKKEYFFFTKIFNRNKIRASSVLKRTSTITYKIAKQFSK